MNVARKFFLADQIFRRAAVRSIADQYQLRAHFLAHDGEHLHDIGDPLHGPEIRKVHQYRLAVRSPFARAFPDRLRQYRSQFTKFGITSIGRLMSNSSTVRCFR